MMRTALTFTIVMMTALHARASDWLTIADFGPLTHRLPITIENPADVDNPSALIHIKLADLATLLPDAKPGQIVVVDPSNTSVPKRERANEHFVPFQINDGVVALALPLAANQKKLLYIYTAPKPLALPGFPVKTGWDNRYAYRSFENNLMAFRIETGPGANTTGMSLDIFGKTARGKGVRLQEIYESGHDSYHKLQYWGIDALKLGSSPGLGGVYVVDGDKLGRANAKDILVDFVHAGPVETIVRMSAPVDVGRSNFKLTRTLTLFADERGIDDVVNVEPGAKVGIGLRNLPNEQWVEKPEAGYALVHGDNNQPNYKSVGLGLVFDPKQYDRTIPLPDATNGGHVYVLNGAGRHHMAAIWDGDGQINNPIDFEKYLQQRAKLLKSRAKLELGQRAERAN